MEYFRYIVLLFRQYFITGSYLDTNITSPGEIYSLFKNIFLAYDRLLFNKWIMEHLAAAYIFPECDGPSDHEYFVTEYQDLKSQHRFGHQLLQLYETPPELPLFSFSIKDVDNPPHDK